LGAIQSDVFGTVWHGMAADVLLIFGADFWF
jgi:hypothetical protein